MSQPAYSTHSAQVELWLDCGEHGKIELARVAPKSVEATTRQTIPPCDAELIVIVDGVVHRRPVRVVRGFENRRTGIVHSVSDVAPF